MAIGKYCQICGQQLQATECIAEVHGVVMTSPCMFEKVYGEKTASRDETRAMVCHCAVCAADLPRPLPEHCPQCHTAVFAETGRAVGKKAGPRPALSARAIAFVLDLVLVAALTYGGALALDMVQAKLLPEGIDKMGMAELAILSFFVSFIVYHTVFGLIGRSPGKLTMGYRVILNNGNPELGLFRALVRSSLYLLIVYILPLGFALLVFQEKRENWWKIIEDKALFHNDLTDTIVVKA